MTASMVILAAAALSSNGDDNAATSNPPQLAKQQPREESNGIYLVTSEPTAPEVETESGLKVRLGQKADIRIRHAYDVLSLNNENTKFRVELETSNYETDRQEITLSQLFVLRVNDRYFSCSGLAYGGTAGHHLINMLQFNVSAQANAEAIARWLSVGCNLRSPPNYRLLAQFIPQKSQYNTNEPVLVTFELRNLDSRTIVFEREEHQRPLTPYRFQAVLGGRPVPYVHDPIHMGGSSFPVTGFTIFRALEPGANLKDQVDLKQWFAFDKLGTYAIPPFLSS